MRKLRQLLWLMAVLFTISILPACDDNQQDDSVDSSPNKSVEQGTITEESKNGGDLVLAISKNPVSLSPQESHGLISDNIMENIYETLTVLDDNGTVQPGLASWEQVDETTWDFYLKEAIEFHDETVLDANAIKTNFDRLVDHEVASPYAFLLDGTENWEVMDELTFRINLSYPDNDLPATLAHNATALMSPDSIAEDYKLMKKGNEPGSYMMDHPIGTGPFQFVEWEEGMNMVLDNNDDYWGDPAELESITFKIIPEQNARMAELETGAAHIAAEIAPNSLKQMDLAKDIHTIQKPSLSILYAGFNMQKKPFNDVNVRKAISLAIDQQHILDDVYNNKGTLASGPLPSSEFDYDDSAETMSHDLKKAKSVLYEAGFEDGFATTIWTDQNKQHIYTADSIQKQLEDIGIDAKTKHVDKATFLNAAANGKQDIFIMEWTYMTGRGAYNLYPLFHSSPAGVKGNPTSLNNDGLDVILETARKEPDPDVQENLYMQALDLLHDLAPGKFILQKESLLGAMETVQNFSIDDRGIFQLKDVSIFTRQDEEL